MNMTGKIVKVLPEKRFGFIDADGVEYFFHRDDFLGHWNDLVDDFGRFGNKIEVQFAEAVSVRGPRARNVTRLDHPNQAV